MSFNSVSLVFQYLYVSLSLSFSSFPSYDINNVKILVLICSLSLSFSLCLSFLYGVFQFEFYMIRTRTIIPSYQYSCIDCNLSTKKRNWNVLHFSIALILFSKLKCKRFNETSTLPHTSDLYNVAENNKEKECIF